MPWFIVGLIFIVLIGFRFDVGGDWGSYLRSYREMAGLTLNAVLKQGDPGYKYLNWLMAQWGWGVYGVNLVSGIIFVIGLTLFCRQQPKPWLTFSVAVPYLIIVVAMGYTRQGVAVGLFMWAITYLERGKLKYYLLLLAIATLFHKSAILMIPLGIFLHGRGRLIRVVAVGVVAYGLWDLLLAEHQEDLWRNYVEAQMRSEGAKIRAFMNLVPSLFLLYFWRKWKASFPNFWFWFWIGFGSILSVVFVGVASTAVDRIGLYFIPIQLVVFSRLPYLANRVVSPNITVSGILVGYSAVLYVWLNYAVNANDWLPYRNALFQ